MFRSSNANKKNEAVTPETGTPSTVELNTIQQPEITEEHIAAERSDLARKYRTTTTTTTTTTTATREHGIDVDTDDEVTVPEELLQEVANEDDIKKKNVGWTDVTTTEEEEEGDKVTTENEATVPVMKAERNQSVSGGGMILEAAFVDPAYTWPPVEGQGKNAIELQASVQLLDDLGDDDSLNTTESQALRMKLPEKPVTHRVVQTVTKSSRGLFGCCCRRTTQQEETIVTDAEQIRAYQEQKLMVEEYRRQHAEQKRLKLRQKEKQYRMKHKYSRVPEGILIYKLDTSTGLLELMSQPHTSTNMETLITEMYVVNAYPSPNKSRRGIVVVGTDGTTRTLIACEQRTATAWLEALNIMCAKKGSFNKASKTANLQLLPSQSVSSIKSESLWSKEKLKDQELDKIEKSYLNLANYSHKLIRAGALPGTKKGSGGAGGVYYSVEKVQSETDPIEEEALEAIAKRRAVIKDSWDFYRMICSLLRDRAKYEEVFRKLQLDPVYPYLNSMTGLNDPGDVGYENLDKQVMQRDLAQFREMTKLQVARELVKQAEKAMPSLVEICKALAGSLGMEEVGVGPIKEPEAAIRKAEKKYGGDILKVTDYCRALLVVKDIPSLLALLELARDSFGPLITRVKMSSLKNDHPAKPGGYRDCIINVELRGHICEIQVHLWPMWVVCGVDGFRHYRHCVEYNTDSFEDAYDALDGLDRKTMAELIVVAEEAVSETPLDNLEWYHEKYILDYFAEAGLFMKHRLDVWAEITFRHLIRLRTESPDIGPNHHATIILYKYLAQCLKDQGKIAEAKEVMEKVHLSEQSKKEEKKLAAKSIWDSFGEVYDMVVDPSRKEREAEEKLRKDIKLSKKRWRKIRQERFPFLDVDVEGSATANDVKALTITAEDQPNTKYEDYEEKKVD